jgi:6-phosphogluconolactonase
MSPLTKFWPSVLLFVVLVLLVSAPSNCTAQEYVYVSNFGDSTLSAFIVDARDGHLVEIPGSPFPSGVGSGAIAAGPHGHFLFTALSEEYPGEPCGTNFAQLLGSRIGVTGNLAQIENIVLPDYCPTDVIVDPSGKFVYVALIDFSNDQGNKVGAIAAYQTSNGFLTAVPGSPFLSPIAVSSGQQPAIGDLAISHDGKVLYASDPNDPAGILIFDRDPNSGTLGFRTTYNSGSAFGPMRISPSGKYLVALPPYGSGVYEYAMGPAGGLEAVPGSPFSSPDVSITNAVAFSPDGEFIAIAETGGILVERKNPTEWSGELSLVPGSPFGSGLPPAITFGSSDYVYVPGAVYKLNPGTGALAQVATFQTGNSAEAILAVKPDTSTEAF